MPAEPRTRPSIRTIFVFFGAVSLGWVLSESLPTGPFRTGPRNVNGSVTRCDARPESERGSSTTKRALDHIGISVPDIDAAVAWYRDVLGCYVLMEPIEGVVDDSHFGRIIRDIFGEDFQGMKVAHLATADGVGIELFQFTANEAQDTPFAYWKTAIFHIAILDPEIEALAKRIDESGGRQRSRIWKLWPDKPYRVCYCEDPWGNIVEISSHPYAMIWSNFTKPHAP